MLVNKLRKSLKYRELKLVIAVNLCKSMSTEASKKVCVIERF